MEFFFSDGAGIFLNSISERVVLNALGSHLTCAVTKAEGDQMCVCEFIFLFFLGGDRQFIYNSVY